MDNNTMLHGEYVDMREQLDYGFHDHYTQDRQMLQDSIISGFLNNKNRKSQISSSNQPWVLFTAGAMGAGKSYTMDRLAKHGHLPMEAFLKVDPDDIRRHLPEFQTYINEGSELAGELTQKEAGAISEILTLAGLQEGRNILVDGSLRDWKWYQGYFQRLRELYPNVRIAILHVTAPKATILQRAERRAQTTGRVVPRELLLATIEQVPKAVAILGPLADLLLEIHNTPKSIELECMSGADSWQLLGTQAIPARRHIVSTV